MAPLGTMSVYNMCPTLYKIFWHVSVQQQNITQYPWTWKENLPMEARLYPSLEFQIAQLQVDSHPYYSTLFQLSPAIQ